MKNIIMIFLFTVFSISIYYFLSTTKKICPKGSVGDNCEYNDIDNCNGNGKVSLNKNGEPVCQCDGNFDGDNCEKCKDGFVGYDKGCIYSDDITCNGKGKVKINWLGNPICLCTPPYDGKNCEKCITGLAGDKCQYSSTEMCGGNGEVYVDEKGNVKCKCKDGWYGNRCEQSGATRCSGNGMFNFEKGKCECKDGYGGSKCQFDSSSCLNRGKLYDYNERVDPPIIKCSCPRGYSGNLCQFKENDICGNRGILKVNMDGKTECICNPYGNFENRKLKNCTECKPGFFGKNCNFSNKNCNGFPISDLVETPITTFNCKCPPSKPLTFPGNEKRSGNKCEYIDREVCNNRGYIDTIENINSTNPTIKCKCDGGDYSVYTGDKCEKCKDGFKGPNCEFNDLITCNGRGTVNNEGKCSCFPSYTGENCDKCKDTNELGNKYYELRFKNNLVCATENDCFNRGKPMSLVNDGNTIKCACNSGYVGDNCKTFFLK